MPHREDVMLVGVDVFRDFYVLYQRQEGLPALQIVSFRDGQDPRHRHRRAGLRPVAPRQPRVRDHHLPLPH